MKKRMVTVEAGQLQQLSHLSSAAGQALGRAEAGDSYASDLDNWAAAIRAHLPQVLAETPPDRRAQVEAAAEQNAKQIEERAALVRKQAAAQRAAGAPYKNAAAAVLKELKEADGPGTALAKAVFAGKKR